MLLTLLTVLGLFAAGLFGQAMDSILVGTVTDSTGAIVAGASVTALNKDTGVKYTSTSSSTGEYRLNNIPVGRYDVSATHQGFATATVAGVELQLNHTSSVNLTLAVGSVNTTVEVTEAAAPCWIPLRPNCSPPTIRKPQSTCRRQAFQKS